MLLYRILFSLRRFVVVALSILHWQRDRFIVDDIVDGDSY